jgi:hypothetical protein
MKIKEIVNKATAYPYSERTLPSILTNDEVQTLVDEILALQSALADARCELARITLRQDWTVEKTRTIAADTYKRLSWLESHKIGRLNREGLQGSL